MFKKMVIAFLKLTVRQLSALGATSIILAMLLIWSVVANESNVFVQVAAVLVVILLAIVAVISLINMFVTLDSNKIEAERKQALETLKGQLSYDEFTNVLFEPKNISSRNIRRCLHVYKDLEVRHFARIDDDDNIIVIAKDANGKESRPEKYDAVFFDANYKVRKYNKLTHIELSDEQIYNG